MKTYCIALIAFIFAAPLAYGQHRSNPSQDTAMLRMPQHGKPSSNGTVTMDGMTIDGMKSKNMDHMPIAGGESRNIDRMPIEGSEHYSGHISAPKKNDKQK